MNDFESALLNFYSSEELDKIQRIKIGLGGAGGLGSNIATALVRSGFKNFEILDKDIIEYSNLNRQYFFLDEVGRPKAETLKERLLKINPDISVKTHKTELTSENSSLYFQDVYILFEAFDSVESKMLIFEDYGNDDTIIISGNGMTGISNKNEIKIRKISSKHFLVGDNSTDINNGDKPYAPRVITCASLMASLALELVTSPDYF